MEKVFFSLCTGHFNTSNPAMNENRDTLAEWSELDSVIKCGSVRKTMTRKTGTRRKD